MVWIGGAGSLGGPERKPLWQCAGYPKEYKKISEGHYTTFQVISSSGLDWTIMYPPKVTPGSNENKYNIFKDNVERVTNFK